VKLQQSLVHIKGFSVSTSIRPQLSEAISCDLDKYEDCFESKSSNTVSCLVSIDCLDFTEISELKEEYNPNYDQFSYINEFINTYSAAFMNRNQATAGLSSEEGPNIDENNQNSHLATETFTQGLYKDEARLFHKQVNDDNQINQFESLSLNQISKKISEVYDVWELARIAVGKEKEKYRDFFDDEWNLIDIDVRLEVLYKAYRKKIHQTMEKENFLRNKGKEVQTFEDVSQEFAENQPVVRKLKKNQNYDSIFNELTENDESFTFHETQKNVEPVEPISENTKTSDTENAESFDSVTQDFEKLWNPGKPETIIKFSQNNHPEDSFIFSEENPEDPSETKNDSEFEPKFQDLDSIPIPSDLSSSSSLSSEFLEKPDQLKNVEFLQENLSCEEDCEKNCKSLEDQDSCISECIYKTCSSSPASSSDYLTVMLTGLALFLVAFIIYSFMKNRSSLIHDSYIKGHTS
jgi:hypothetical protein